MAYGMPDPPPPDDRVVRDAHDVHCIGTDDSSVPNCTMVALFDVVLSRACDHLHPYPLCMKHKDLVVTFLSTPRTRMKCGQCAQDPGVIQAVNPLRR